MTPDKASPQKFVSIVSTGSELVNGETLNTTAFAMARALSKKNIQVRHYWTVSDSEEDILHALSVLLPTSEALIITGGLGPTSDDRTRHVVSRFVARELVFRPESWERIVKRLSRYGLKAHESNRQQAMFPEGALIIPNPNGSAEGCELQKDEKLIFMLPGPPKECLPMLDDFVLTRLIQAGFPLPGAQFAWKLLGGIEGEIGAKVDSIVGSLPIETAFCWRYPYLEVTLRTKVEAFSSVPPSLPSSLIAEIRTALQPYIVTENDEKGRTASQLLIDYLSENKVSLQIEDLATGGCLEKAIRVPATVDKVSFVSASSQNPEKSESSRTLRAIVTGLTDYWRGSSELKMVKLQVEIQNEDQVLTTQTQIPLRGHEVREYAAEYVAFQILRILRDENYFL